MNKPIKVYTKYGVIYRLARERKTVDLIKDGKVQRYVAKSKADKLMAQGWQPVKSTPTTTAKVVKPRVGMPAKGAVNVPLHGKGSVATGRNKPVAVALPGTPKTAPKTASRDAKPAAAPPSQSVLWKHMDRSAENDKNAEAAWKKLNKKREKLDKEGKTLAERFYRTGSDADKKAYEQYREKHYKLEDEKHDLIEYSRKPAATPPAPMPVVTGDNAQPTGRTVVNKVKASKPKPVADVSAVAESVQGLMQDLKAAGQGGMSKAVPKEAVFAVVDQLPKLSQPQLFELAKKLGWDATLTPKSPKAKINKQLSEMILRVYKTTGNVYH